MNQTQIDDLKELIAAVASMERVVEVPGVLLSYPIARAVSRAVDAAMHCHEWADGLQASAGEATK